ncbi:MAG TPA: hypothetical protein VET85_04865 [Stellaceae bacterium]|nr:hypothetical protein [Stellaceae bacterium]
MSLKQLLNSGAALGALTGVALMAASPATAQTAQAPSAQQMSAQIDTLQQQIQQLQKQVQSFQSQVAATPGQVAQGNPNGIQIGGVTLKFGGFIEAASIWRSRNQVSDVGSDYNGGIPFKNSVLAHETEFRESARQSRISGLATGDVNQDTHLAAYIESDFLSSGTNSNSRESNSYVPRIRHGYTTLDKDDWGLHVLAGQTWSLLTTNTNGIIPRQEQIPLTIDAQYVEGFNWKRQPQLRVVENFGGGFWAGLSLESPQGSLAAGAPSITTAAGAGTNASPNTANLGDAAGLLNNTTGYTNDIAPDIIGKIAIDPGFGHYELKALARAFSDHTGIVAGSNNGTNNVTWGYGAGAAVTLPLVPKVIDFQLSGLVGRGIGTYGSGQLPDVAVTANGNLQAVPEIQGLVGLIAHPFVGNDTYLYGGWEHADRTATFAGSAGAIGYGSGAVNNVGCGSACGAQTENLKQIAIGTWQDVYKGNYGRWVVGLQGSYLDREAFTGAHGIGATTDDYIVMTSIRYYPF